MSDWTGGVCIFGPFMAQNFDERPFYSVTVYMYFIPLCFAMIILGKALNMATYLPVFVNLGLIIATDLSVILFNSVYTCNTDWITDKGWWWFAIIY
jgi:hypothetical protein